MADTIEYALFSVYDKEGIEVLAQGLVECGLKILSSGGTARYLRERGIEVTSVEELRRASLKARLLKVHLPWHDERVGLNETQIDRVAELLGQAEMFDHRCVGRSTSRT